MGRVSTCQKNCKTIDLRGAQVNKWHDEDSCLLYWLTLDFWQQVSGADKYSICFAVPLHQTSLVDIIKHVIGPWETLTKFYFKWFLSIF